MKIPQPLHTFRIYPGSRHGKYYQVQVFRTLKDMRQHCRRSCHSGISNLRDTYGVCHRFIREWIPICGGHRRVSKHCGNIHVTRKVSTEIAIHECTHAAFYHVMNDDKPLSEIMDVDEPLAMACGWLSRQMTIGLHDAGVWK